MGSIPLRLVYKRLVTLCLQVTALVVRTTTPQTQGRTPRKTKNLELNVISPYMDILIMDVTVKKRRFGQLTPILPAKYVPKSLVHV